MKRNCLTVAFIVLQVLSLSSAALAGKLIPANDPNLQYFGRWDKTDSLHPRYSWPGIYLVAEFSGTSIGIRLADGTNYFNVYIDGKLHSVFHGTNPAETDYVLADSLPEARHTLLFSRRNITFEKPYTFCGLIVDAGAVLFPPPAKPPRKIEFIGASFVAGESNEATEVGLLKWEDRFPVTNIDKGFAPLIARHFNAQYTTTCRSGAGMYCDWRGDTNESIPRFFDRTLMEANEPKWDFKQWVPDVVVIDLGFNDYDGLKDKEGNIFEEKSAAFRTAYHHFLETLRSAYPGTRIVVLAPFPEWIRSNLKRIIDDEKLSGNYDINYAQYDNVPGGYVAHGHPTVETHKKMASQIIESMDTFNLFHETSGK
ncbi:MAG TPA: SGNH/GDSL hydrolase family protein [Bacteroidota bacterium]|nr:SGNH/GDSL hydrolase family protein [Bacteroidota bacterium]